MVFCTKCRVYYIGVIENQRERTINSKSHVRNGIISLNPDVKHLCRCSFLTES